METKRTPGLWVVESMGMKPGAFSVVGDGQQMVALVYGRNRKEQQANANAIGALPDLLRALVLARKEIVHRLGGNERLIKSSAPIFGIDAALAKAEGRQIGVDVSRNSESTIPQDIRDRTERKIVLAEIEDLLVFLDAESLRHTIKMIQQMARTAITKAKDGC